MRARPVVVEEIRPGRPTKIRTYVNRPHLHLHVDVACQPGMMDVVREELEAPAMADLSVAIGGAITQWFERSRWNKGLIQDVTVRELPAKPTHPRRSR